MGIKSIVNNDMIRYGSYITAAMLLARFSGYLFQIVVARSLGPIDYGIFGSLFSLFMIFSIPVNTVQMVLSRFVSEYLVEGQHMKIKSLLASAYKKMFALGIVSYFLFMLASIPLSNFLKIGSLTLMAILGISLILSFIAPINMGILQGLQNFRMLGLTMSLQSIGRLLFVLFFLYLGLGLKAVVFSLSLGLALSVLISTCSLKGYFHLDKSSPTLELGEIYRYSYPVLITTGALLFIHNIDVVLVKHFFSSEVTGLYSAASFVGKILVFLGSALSISLFPTISRMSIKAEDARHLVKKGMLMFSFISMAFTTLVLIFDKRIIDLLYGTEFSASASYLPYFALAMSFLGISTIAFWYLLAIKRYDFIIPLLAISTIELMLLLLLHGSIYQYLAILNSSFFIIMCMGLYFAFK